MVDAIIERVYIRVACHAPSLHPAFIQSLAFISHTVSHPWRKNEAGIYSQAAFIQGNTVVFNILVNMSSYGAVFSPAYTYLKDNDSSCRLYMYMYFEIRVGVELVA